MYLFIRSSNNKQNACELGVLLMSNRSGYRGGARGVGRREATEWGQPLLTLIDRNNFFFAACSKF